MTFGEVRTYLNELYGDDAASPSDYAHAAKAIGALDDKDFPHYFRPLKAAFLSSFTIQGLGEITAARSFFHQIKMETYAAPYNQVTQEVLKRESGLTRFSPEIVYALLDATDIIDAAHLETIARGLLELPRAKIVFCNFVTSKNGDGKKIKVLNEFLSQIKNKEQRISVFDLENFLRRIGKSNHWYTKYKDLGDLRVAPAAFVPLSEEFAKYAIAAAGNTKKCLVLDLDNTLWNGIVGEDGLAGVVPDRALQKQILALHEKGTVLAISSRNNLDDAFSVIEGHPDMILKKNHFAAWRINWESKDKNIAELAEELNLGTDSFVFVDDDPFQRELVSGAFPEVTALAPEALEHYAGFYAFSVTDEDRQRGTRYAQERQRTELKKSFRTEEDFLRELAMKIDVRAVSEEHIARVSQLTQKTNQFNLTTRRYSEEEVRERMRDGWHLWTVSVTDRFGDYGIVGVVMIEPKDNAWRIDNFLLSCRILGRRVEDHIIRHVKESARAAHVSGLKAEYRKTAKNHQTEKFWDGMDFQPEKDNTGEIKQYYFQLA